MVVIPTQPTAAGISQPTEWRDASHATADRSMSAIRTAVVVVHGMGEQRPLETLNSFVDTALLGLPDAEDEPTRRDYYYSRPAEITQSFEARRYIAPQLGNDPLLTQGHTEIFEYHWSYLMTGNRFGDLIPTTLRLLVRPPWRVPQPLRGIWTLVWLVLVSAPTAYLVISPHLAGIQWAVIGSGLGLAVMALIVRQAKAGVTASFVDVVRYLDTSPRSYAARREIRGGMVDLLRALHDGHYSRIVVVAHGGTINAIVADLLGLERTFFFEAGYTSISRLGKSWQGEGYHVVSLNEMSHLDSSRRTLGPL